MAGLFGFGGRMRIGVIGTGFMAAQVVRTLTTDGHEIRVSPRSRARAESLNAAFDAVTIADNDDVLRESDVIVVGLLADVAKSVLPGLTFRPDHSVISLMAGLPRDALADLVAPANQVTTAIPFPFVAQGGSPLLLYPDSDVVRDLLGKHCALICPESEAVFNSYLAVQAVLSPVLTLLEQSTEWLARHGADKADAGVFLQNLVAGSLTARPDGEVDPFTEMLAELNTPGGLNAELREHMIAAGMVRALQHGLDQLDARLNG